MSYDNIEFNIEYYDINIRIKSFLQSFETHIC